MKTVEQINDFERRKRVIEDLLEDYRQSLLAYAEWMDAWRKRQRDKHAGSDEDN